jgi:phosphoribosylaminoimidazole-succinocarboxamide synthase
MKNLELLYEGKAKKVYDYTQNKVVIEFKDDVTAFNGVKKDNIYGKGAVNKKISVFFFNLLERKGIKTHLIKDIDERRFLAKKIQIIPLEVVVRNYAAGSFCKRYNVENGKRFISPIVEFFLKDDNLNDPLIAEDTITALNIISVKEIDDIKNLSLKINRIMREYLDAKDIILVDFKLEFGKLGEEIILGDEISPDTCRFWDKSTKTSLDKDVYRNSTGNLIETYKKVLKRLGL